MGEYLTEDQAGKLGWLGKIKKVAAEIQFAPLDTRPADVRELTQTLYALHGYCGLAIADVKDDPELREKLLSLRRAIHALTQRRVVGNRQAVAGNLGEFQ